jgi:acyl-CoA synthetase (AMP-forming)/AMP-acid ligase II/thioesterase domain-containing protein
VPEPDSPRLHPLAIAAAVETWAEDDPERLAAADTHSSITYGELAGRASSLAGRLTSQAEPSSSPWLPILVDRSVRSLVGLVAALWAGTPFVPIDATAPNARLGSLLARLGSPSRVVNASTGGVGSLPPGLEVIVEADTPGDRATPRPVARDDPGLVVFTSGSTGEPKGVVRVWGSLDGPTKEFRARADAGAVERVAMFRPLTFTAGLNDLGAFGGGHSLHLLDPSQLAPGALLDWLRSHQITWASLGASVGSTLVETTEGDLSLPDLTTVRLGGESTSWDLVARLRNVVAPDARFVSTYAASEAGRIARLEIDPNSELGAGPLPLGRPVRAGTVRLEPLEDDPSCEQVVVRDPVAVCYLDDPERSAQRFVTDADGARWWRSGDLATIDSDGVLHHRGRVDEMVKINGFRVEPAEARAALLAIPGIAAAAVVVHTTGTGRTRLVAHLEVTDDQLTPHEVRLELDRRLPKHLVPQALVRHDRLPVTERNKVDLDALRRAPVERWRPTPTESSRDERVQWIAGQVARVLDLGDVGVDEDIWHLGLDSLGALELCAALSTGSDPLDPTLLLSHRTASRIASLVDAPAGETGSAVVLNSGGSRQPLLVVPGGGGTAFAFRSLAQLLGADQPLVVLEPRGMHRPGPVDRTFEAIVEAALVQSRAFDRGESWGVLGYSAGGPTAFELARRLHDTGRAVHLILLDASPVHDSGGRRPNIGTRVGNRTLAENLRVVPMSVRRRWYVFRPGKPNYDRARYDAFATILRRANQEHAPVAADVPTTVIHVDGNEWNASVAQRWLRHVEVHRVGGDHFSMLHPPYVHDVWEIVRQATERDSDPVHPE